MANHDDEEVRAVDPDADLDAETSVDGDLVLDADHGPVPDSVLPGSVLLHDAPYETSGRVDPIYEPAVQQYHAPVAESRSFGSRFWWLIPLLLLLILLPLVLNRCAPSEVYPLSAATEFAIRTFPHNSMTI